MAVTPDELLVALPGWKRQERSDLCRELVEIRQGDRRLYDRAMRAYDSMGAPVTVVVWAAKCAWAQGTPGDFGAILANHIEGSLVKLRDLTTRSFTV